MHVRTSRVVSGSRLLAFVWPIQRAHVLIQPNLQVFRRNVGPVSQLDILGWVGSWRLRWK
jgi:hypothetical protein